MTPRYRNLEWEPLGEGFYLRRGSRVLATIAPCNGGWLWKGLGGGNRLPVDLATAQTAAMNHVLVVMRAADRAEGRP